MCLSAFGIRVVLTSWNDFGSVLPLLLFGRICEEFGFILHWMFCRIQWWRYLGLGSTLWTFWGVTDLISSLVIVLFQISTSFWVSFSRMCLSWFLIFCLSFPTWLSVSIGGRCDKSAPGLWTAMSVAGCKTWKEKKISQGSTTCESIEARMCISKGSQDQPWNRASRTLEPRGRIRTRRYANLGREKSNKKKGRLRFRQKDQSPAVRIEIMPGTVPASAAT